MFHAATAQADFGPRALPSRKAGEPASRPLLAVETARLVLRGRRGEDPNLLRVTILLRPELEEVGWIEFRLRDGTEREVELGFFIAPSCRGRGLMREAARAALPPAARILDARLLSATLPADVPAAEGVVRALGLAASSRRGSMRRFEKDLCGLI